MPTPKQFLMVAGIVLVLAGIAWVALATPPAPALPEPGAVPGTASTTDLVATSSTAQLPTKKTLAPETPFVLPPGAVAIDGYAYIENDLVYFRSLTGKTPLAIPNSDAESFTRLSNFMTYPGTEVVTACGAAPLYAYYGDDKHVYFYQVWRASTFRSSRVEVIIGAKTDDFRVTGLETATDGSHLYEVEYGKATATSTCKLSLSRTTL